MKTGSLARRSVIATLGVLVLALGGFATLITLRYALKDPVREKLPHVGVPTLVVRGSRDPIAPQPWVEEMVRLLPRGRLLVIPGGTHAANMSAPDALARGVHQFLAETAPERPAPARGRGCPGRRPGILARPAS